MIPIEYITHLHSNQIENQLIEIARDMFANPLDHYVEPPYRKNTKRGPASIKMENKFSILDNYEKKMPIIEYDYRFLNAIKNDPNTPVASAYVEEHFKKTPHFLFWGIAQQTVNNFNSIEIEGTPKDLKDAIESFIFKPEQHLSTGNGFVKNIFFKRKEKWGSFWITIDFGFGKLKSEEFHHTYYIDGKTKENHYWFKVHFDDYQKETVRNLLFLHQLEKHKR